MFTPVIDVNEIYDNPINEITIDVVEGIGERSKSPNKFAIGNNDISVINNNTTNNDTSMNLTQIDLINKLDKSAE
jgi:hypothetical protein